MIVKTTKIFSERLLPFLTSKTILLAMMLVFVVAANAQIKGGILPGDDFDGDTIINSVDADDDNDGILDTDENKGSIPLLSGFEALYPAVLPPDSVGSDTTPALVLPANPIGSRVIVRNAVTYQSIPYHAIVEITGYGALGSGRVAITKPGDDLALVHTIPANNPYFTYSLKFVSSVGFVDANYQNTNPIVGATIPNVTVVLADIDGKTASKPEDAYSEVAGYKSAGVTSVKIGTDLQAGGFDFPTPGTQGPGAGVFNYYRPVGASNTAGSPSISASSQPNWITISYTSFTVGEYVYGGIAPTPSAGKPSTDRGEGGPSIYMGNVDFTDVDGDAKDNSFDLDSDNDGCSDSNEAYKDIAKANTGYQFGNPAVTATGPNPIPAGLGGVAPANQDDLTDPWTPIYGDGKVKAASYTIVSYTPVVTPTRFTISPNGNPVDVKIDPGQTATFSAIIEGVSVVGTYKWEQRINSSAPWASVNDGGVYSGTTTKTLTITNVPVSMGNYEYRIVVDDMAGNYICDKIYSTAAVLKFNNLAPVTIADPINTNEDTTGSVDVTTNDSDVPDNVAVGTVDLDPSTPIEDKTYTVAGKGKFDILNPATGVVTFSPEPNFNGSFTITYTVKDTKGAVSVATNINVVVAPVNDAPVANPDTYSVAEDNTVVLTPLANDNDIKDSEIPKIASINGVALTPGTAQTITVSNGTISITAANVISFTPVKDFNSATAIVIPYIINDGSNTANSTANSTISITVTPDNDAPVAKDDTATTTKGVKVIITVLSNDTDVDGNNEINKASIDLDPNTAGIQPSLTVSGEGTYTVNTTAGTVEFQPLATFDKDKATKIEYVIQDNSLAVSNKATIEVSLNVDSDGDGVLDATEITDGTDPMNPCNSNQKNATLPKSGLFLTTDCNIQVLTTFSPNGDGDNEKFMIKRIEDYPNNTLQVYDRWGVVVYEATGYGQGDKFFTGQSNGRSTVSASGQLPVGTYFYALKYVDSNGEGKERSGYLYINR